MKFSEVFHAHIWIKKVIIEFKSVENIYEVQANQVLAYRQIMDPSLRYLLNFEMFWLYGVVRRIVNGEIDDAGTFS